MKDKSRVTLFVCTNESGTCKLPLAMIGKAKEPRCFNRQEPPMKYFSQKKAWSDTKVMKEWWKFFLSHVRRFTKEKVLLIMDNCGPHENNLIDENNQIQVEFLPPNTTSKYQPMDAGIIALLKRGARKKYLNKLLDVFEKRTELRTTAEEIGMRPGTMGIDQGCAPHILDAMKIIGESWDNISQATIQNCWRHCNLRANDTPNVVDTNVPANAPILDRDTMQLLAGFQEMALCVDTAPVIHPSRPGVTNPAAELDEMVHAMSESLRELFLPGSMRLADDAAARSLDQMMGIWYEVEKDGNVCEMMREEVQEEMDKVLDGLEIDAFRDEDEDEDKDTASEKASRFKISGDCSEENYRHFIQSTCKLVDEIQDNGDFYDFVPEMQDLMWRMSRRRKHTQHEVQEKKKMRTVTLDSWLVKKGIEK